MFVCPGEILDIPHYGQMKQFYVTLVKGCHGTLELSSHDQSGDESLTTHFESLSMSYEIVNDVSHNASKHIETHNLHCTTVDNTGESSIDGSNISTYYSFSDKSVHESTCDNQESSTTDLIFASTPVKVDNRKSGNPREISCRRCSNISVAYYVTAVATELIIDQSRRDKTASNRDVKEKLCYDSVGGLDKQIETLKEMVELSIKSPDLFHIYGK